MIAEYQKRIMSITYNTGQFRFQYAFKRSTTSFLSISFILSSYQGDHRVLQTVLSYGHIRIDERHLRAVVSMGADREQGDGLTPVPGLDDRVLPARLPTPLNVCPTARTEFSGCSLGHSSGAPRLYRPTGDRVANRRYVLTSAGDRTAR